MSAIALAGYAGRRRAGTGCAVEQTYDLIPQDGVRLGAPAGPSPEELRRALDAALRQRAAAGP